MRRPAALALLPAVSALALVSVACSSSDSASDTTTSTSSATSTSTSEATTSTTTDESSTTTPTDQACRTDELTASLGPSNAGAGQVYAPLILRNGGTRTCTVRGFPGVSLLDSAGNQLGDPATREGTEGAAVSLTPGASASATLHTTNEGIGGTTCTPQSAQMKVYPPNQTSALIFAAEYTACGGFSVTTLVAGDTGTA